jgi:predicted N-formylglutamate amidohydrolase
MAICATTVNQSGNEVVEVVNPEGAGDILIVCEHASKQIPASFGNLGLDAAALASHIAWDPGALAVARTMSAQLDATLVAQRFSRLLYDCNRPPESPSAVPKASEIYEIPGNSGLSIADRQARVDQFYVPFRDTLAACIDRRISDGRPPVLVTVHSFTPVYKGVKREVELGILHGTDARLADVLIDTTRATGDLTIRRNEPYGPKDGVIHTLDVHAAQLGLLNVMLEIRNDLIADGASQTKMAEWLSRCLIAALGLIAENTGRQGVA